MLTSTRYYSNRLRRFSTAWAILMCLLLTGFMPTPVKAQLGSRVVVGYFHNWNASQAPYIRLRDVNTKYNVINIAFAVPVSHGDMTMTFAPVQQSKAEFIADIRALQAQGRRVQISIGGADAPVELHTTADRDKFVSSMKTIIAEYGFDGYDIDLEGTSVILNSGDADFKNPTTPKINNLISASREIVNYFRGQGKNFWLTAAPETQYVQGGYGYYGTAFGGYLPVLYGLRDLLNFVHVQYYNTGSQVALDEKIYSQGTADFIVAMTDMLLKGFPVARNMANVFPALREDQVAFGLPATNTGAAPAGGYVAPAQVYQALNYLIKGIAYGGQYTTSKSYPNLRGIMTWSVNWDKTQGDAFANSYYSYFSGLGGNTLPTVSITSPVNNASFSPGATVTIAANASDGDGSVSKVEFFQNGAKLGEDTSSPYSYSWSNVAAGSYTLTAKATDNLGGATTSAGVSISVTSGSNIPPTVSITSPSNGATFTAPASITISANAADADGSVSKVEFYNGSTKLGEDTSSPYTYAWSNVPSGAYALTAIATDNLNASTTSTVVSLTVTGSSDNCSGVAQYVENGGYAAGSVVKNAGSKYECKPWPYSGWCNGAAWAYGPGTGMHWQDAWTLVSSCSGLQAESLVTLTDLPATTAVAAAATDFKVVGYMPSWSGSASAIQYSKVTHINYAFIRPTTTGGLTAVDNAQKLRDIVSLAHANGVKVGIAIGGWSDLNNTDFQTMAANASYRSNFINNVISFINTYQLDGVDLDWEYPVEGQDPANFSTLMTELGNAMHSRGKFLTAAVSAQGYYANGVLSGVFNAVDFLNIMVYDGGSGADHSPYSYAISSLNYWQGRGLPASKTVLGVPFYARPSWKSFATLVAEGANPNSDTYNGDYFNGISTIKQKTNLAFDRGLGGMMIWELSQDATGSNSLLSAIKQVVDERNGSGTTQSPYGGTVRTIPGKIEAEHYDLGGQGVAYNDLSAGNSGSAFRSDNVDLEASTDAGTGYNVGWVQAGEWLEYTVNVATAGSYSLEVRVAATAAGNSFHIELDGVNVSGTITVPNTTGWQTWQSVTVTTTSLTAGQKVLRIVMDTGDFNLNYVNFSSSTSNPPPSVGITSPATGATYTAPATLTINASASDNGSVTKVEFFQGSTKLGEDTSSPYAYTWSNVTAGVYSITAKATDNGGATATSSAVNITVNTSTGGCGGAPQYVENGGYVAGSQVQNAGGLYQCREWPYSGWCNGAAWAYGPGTGTYWQDAWTLVASCSPQTLAAAEVSTEETDGIVIYPNPGASNKQQTVTFTFGAGAGDVTVQLKTADGNNLYSRQYPDIGKNLNVELPALPPGLYLLRIEGEQRTWVRRYIIK
jgi:chitinase